MGYCNHCGNKLAEGVKFCTVCGNAQTTGTQATPYTQQTQPPLPPYQHPGSLPATTYEEPISTGSYVGILLLLAIPLVNILCLLIWACGGCHKRNLTNLSRAMLVWMVIGLILGTLVSLAAGALFSAHLEELRMLPEELKKLSETYQP